MLAGCAADVGASDELWAFGGGDVLVVSPAVVDGDGNDSVMVALGAQPDENGVVDPCTVALVSLNADGQERWRTVNRWRHSARSRGSPSPRSGRAGTRPSKGLLQRTNSAEE